MAALDHCPVITNGWNAKMCDANVLGLVGALVDGDEFKCEKGHVLILKIDEKSFKVSLVPK